MGFRVGRIIVPWVLLFLIMFIVRELEFIKDLVDSFGTTMDAFFVAVMIIGLIFISLLDASLS